MHVKHLHSDSDSAPHVRTALAWYGYVLVWGSLKLILISTNYCTFQRLQCTIYPLKAFVPTQSSSLTMQPSWTGRVRSWIAPPVGASSPLCCHRANRALLGAVQRVMVHPSQCSLKRLELGPCASTSHPGIPAWLGVMISSVDIASLDRGGTIKLMQSNHHNTVA